MTSTNSHSLKKGGRRFDVQRAHNYTRDCMGLLVVVPKEKLNTESCAIQMCHLYCTAIAYGNVL